MSQVASEDAACGCIKVDPKNGARTGHQVAERGQVGGELIGVARDNETIEVQIRAGTRLQQIEDGIRLRQRLAVGDDNAKIDTNCQFLRQGLNEGAAGFTTVNGTNSEMLSSGTSWLVVVATTVADRNPTAGCVQRQLVGGHRAQRIVDAAGGPQNPIDAGNGIVEIVGSLSECHRRGVVNLHVKVDA